MPIEQQAIILAITVIVYGIIYYDWSKHETPVFAGFFAMILAVAMGTVITAAWLIWQ